MFKHAFITSLMMVLDITFSPVGTFGSGTTYLRKEHRKAIMSQRTKKNKTKKQKPEAYFIQASYVKGEIE